MYLALRYRRKGRARESMGRFSRRRLLAGVVVGGGLAVGGCSPLGGEGPARPVTQEIVVWLRDQNDDARRVFADRIVPSIERLAPGLRLRIEWKSWDGRVLDAAVGGGEGSPDVFQFGYADAVGLAAGGGVTDLTSRWAGWGAGGDFVAACRAAVWWQGAMVGVPTGCAPWTVFWRRDLLEEIGVQDTPTTWEETLEVARQAKMIENGVLRREGMNPPTADEVLSLFMSVSGRPVVVGGRSQLNSADGRMVLRYVIDRWQASQDETMRLSLADTAGPPLLAGARVGQYGNAAGTLRHFVTTAPELMSLVEVGTPPVPGGTDYKPNAPGLSAPVALTYTDSIAMTAATRAPDMAWEAIRQLASPEVLAMYAETLFVTPPRRSATGRGYTLENGQAELVAGVERWGVGAPKFPGLAEFRAAIEKRLALLLVGRLNIEEVLMEIETEQNEALRARGFTGDIVPVGGIRG